MRRTQTRTTLLGATLCYVPCFIMLLLSSHSLASIRSIQSYAFDPLVISTSVVESAVLTVHTDGSPTSLSLAFSNGTKRSLTHRGDGVYTITVTHQEALFDYQTDDVNRNFVGFLDVYDGETRTSRGNMFINVEDASIPETSVEDIASDIRISSHLVNFYLPDIDPSTLSFQYVSRLFYKHFQDDFDFLNIVSTPAQFANRSYSGVRNYVRGTGKPLYDYSEWYSDGWYGSSDRLLGIVRFPIGSVFDLAAKGYLHELGHQWINFSDTPKLQGVIPHWPISSLASAVMGWQSQIDRQGLEFPFDIIELPNDQYQLIYQGQRQWGPTYFNAMELYLMGMESAANAGSYIVFENQNQQLCNGCILEGPVVSYDVNDLIASEGERIPSFPNDQVSFRAATIIVSKARLLTYREMKFFNHFAARGEATEVLPSAIGFGKRLTAPFKLATGGVGTLSTTISDSLKDKTNQSREVKLQELYVGILGRAADRPGLDYWLGLVSNGFFYLEGTRAAFTHPDQAEYTEIYGGLDNTQLVIATYENFLERAPEAAGLAYWVGELDAGRVNPDHMINAVINAIRDPSATGEQSSKDLSCLRNKIEAAMYFTEETKEYYFDEAYREMARAVVANVTDDPETVIQAKAMIDEYVGN